MTLSLTYLVHFGLGLLSSFLGSLPFGTVNLSVIDTTISKSFKAGVVMAFAAGLVEILQSFLAVHFGMFITDRIENSVWVKVFVFILLLAVGAYFFFRNQNPDLETEESKKAKKKFKLSPFSQGAFLALINPQALPYYVFIVAFLQSKQWLSLEMGAGIGLLAAFLIGISAGRFLCLLLYSYLSLLIAKRLQDACGIMNKVLGSIFFILAAVQGIKLVF